MRLNLVLLHIRDELTISYRRKVLFSICALFIIILSIYGNSLDCSWHFDDKPNITDNTNLHLEEISWDGIKKTLYSDRRNPASIYRPVACLSFGLNFYFGHLDVFGFHLINILIHGLSSVLLFLFLYDSLNLPSLKPKYASKAYSISLLAAVLWAINPVQIQAVTYIVQRMASLAGLFYLTSMYLYLKARIAEKSWKKTVLFTLCFLSFVMAFGSKENAVMLPLSLLLYEALLIQEVTVRFLRKNRLKVAFFLSILMVPAFLYFFSKGGDIFSILGMGAYEARPFSLIQRLLTEPRIVIFYISLLLYPVPGRLSIAHSIRISTSLFEPVQTLISVVLILGAISFLIFTAKKYPLFSFCYLFFFMNHLIESTLLPLELIFEHRNYIPSMFFFVPVAIGFCFLLERYAEKRTMLVIVASFIILLMIGLGHSTFIRNFAWKNPKSLWVDAAEKAHDQFRVHHNLALSFQDQGYEREAIKEYEKALESPVIHRRDEKIITYHNLGKIYAGQGDYEKAEFYYQKALQEKPDFFDSLAGLALVYEKKGNDELFQEYLKKAIRANPGEPSINFNMGLYCLKNGLPDKAIYHLKASMKDEALKKKALLNVGVAYKQKGFLEEAVLSFKESLRADPQNITPRLHLAEIFLRTGDEIKARQEAEKIVDLMLKNEDLFFQTIDHISEKGNLGEVQLSAKLLFGLISRVLGDNTGQTDEEKAYLKKIMEKQNMFK